MCLKGGASQFVLRRHLEQALNASETAQIRSKSENLAVTEVVPRLATPQLRTTIVAECFCLFVWVMGPGFEGCYVTLLADKAPRSGFSGVGERPDSVEI